MSVTYSAPPEFQPQTGIVPRTGLSYISAGTGNPVVLLHGWGGFKEAWWGAMRSLSQDYAVYAFDWPGHGSPALTPGQPVLDALVELAAGSLDALGLRHVTLAGHSFGGNVAARLALARPDLVSRLVLVDAAIDAEHLSPTSRLCTHPRIGERVLRLNRYLCWPLVRLGGRVPHDHAGGFLRPMARRQTYMARVDERVLFEFLVALCEGSLGDRVSQITQPVLVVAGERDPLVHPRQARDLAAKIPRSELCMLRRAYHCPMDEQPAAFNRALAGFLMRNPPDLHSLADTAPPSQL